jgi:hypothetical protein
MRIVLAFLISMATAAGAAQISKCVDRSGKVVGYANECPAGTRSDAMEIRSSPAPAPAATPAGGAAAQPKSLAERDADFRKRQIEKEEATAKADKKSAESEQQKRACEQAQGYLKALQSGQRVARVDPKTGERAFLSDADYPKELAEAQRSVASNCK